MMRRVWVLLAVVGLVLVGCGNDDTEVSSDPPEETSPGDDTTETEPADTGATETTEPEIERPTFAGSHDVDHETGNVDVSEYASFLAEHGPPAGGGPVEASLEMLSSMGDETPPQVSESAAEGGRSVVTVTFDNLLDDSVAAIRYELVFVSDGGLILESGSWASRCQPNRGHQEFDTGLCI